MERTFVMVKPDGVHRRLVGAIVSRFERRGLKLTGIKGLTMDEDLAGRHYQEHRGKGFYDSLVSYITSGPVVAMVWTGTDAIGVVRTMLGATDPREAAPGTIRADFALEIGRNVVHGSASSEDASREIALFFTEDELIGHDACDQQWISE